MNVTARATQFPAASGSGLIFQYSYLQLLDVLTTLAFLLAGVQEANPLARWLMHVTGAPLPGLIAIKVLALLLGVYCWWRGRNALLRKANVFFSLVVAWNLCCLILGLAAKMNA
jgi:hypothetical protein